MEQQINLPRILSYTLAGVLTPVTVALACITIPGIPAIAPMVAGLFLALVIYPCRRPYTTSARAATGALTIVVGSVWASVAATAGMSALGIVVLVVGGLADAAVIVALPAPLSPEELAARAEAMGSKLPPGRTEQEEEMQALLRRLSKTKITVTKIEPWENPEDGIDVRVLMVEGMEIGDVANLRGRIQSSEQLKLPQGCIVTVLDSEFQCEAIIRIMRRDCLNDYISLEDHESSEPASVNNPFPLMRSPQGNWFMVCLRIFCMLIGGTTGSGKTTLLNRIIAYLARCTDALIWVVDFNGGGLGAPWNRPFEEGMTQRPIIDWLADNPAEAAAAMACAKAIAKSRKTDRESVRLRREARTNILPISRDKPAIVVITDEGGEVRQAAGILAQIVCSQISSLAQIGRETGVRVIMSVLRGTATLLDKGLRAVCAIRVCLRMDEKSEYSHIIGENPGKARLMHTGSAWIFRTTEDFQPDIGRSVDVSPDFIERHARACEALRPSLDEAGQAICRNVGLDDVFDGRNPENYSDLLDHPALVDVTRGAAYSRRHERRAQRLAAIDRGEDPDHVTQATTSIASTGKPDPGSATAKLLDQVSNLGGRRKPRADSSPEGSVASTSSVVASDDDVFGALTSGQHLMRNGRCPVDPQDDDDLHSSGPRSDEGVPDAPSTTLRERINLLLSDIYPNGLKSGEIEEILTNEGFRYSRGNLFEVLKAMVNKHGEVDKEGNRYFHRTLT